MKSTCSGIPFVAPPFFFVLSGIFARFPTIQTSIYSFQSTLNKQKGTSSKLVGSNTNTSSWTKLTDLQGYFT